MSSAAEKILASRREVGAKCPSGARKAAEEGGCGVVGFAADVPVRGRHIFEPSIQMHNRGNGKGGGIACASFEAEQLGVDEALLREDYILQVALFDSGAEKLVEEHFVLPHLRVDHRDKVIPAAEYGEIGLDVRPPDVVRYFVRVQPGALAAFAREHGLEGLAPRLAEDEFIYRNSFRLNRTCYASLGEQRAFVLSHARDLMIFKIVGYAEQVVQYYGLEDMRARIWIAHQRYPTKGRVWHPAGSHPFVGMNEALVHNGDFANYHSIVEYLSQHNIAPMFLTDTEVSVLLFDLLHRVYQYPLECVIEALAPTTEFDFDQLPAARQAVYRAVQAVHMHGSPDGPWFFIIAQTAPDTGVARLLGITDTAMLRPQVFALQEGDVAIGLVASEKQAIDATLHSLSQEDSRFRPVADCYWNARGGSHTDGGAFVFTVARGDDGAYALRCTDKFGAAIVPPAGEWTVAQTPGLEACAAGAEAAAALLDGVGSDGEFTEPVRDRFATWGPDHFRALVDSVRARAEADPGGTATQEALGLLTALNDGRYDCGRAKRSVVLQFVQAGIDSLLDAVPGLDSAGPGQLRRIDWRTRGALRPARDGENTLVVCARAFAPEGEETEARLTARAYELGWRRFIVYGLRGQRFTGCGFGPGTDDVRIDVYGSSGDYLASGCDGMELRVHGAGQDQLAQIMKSGKLVVYGDVGQAFMYGAKGGEVYVMGNAAGRPLINAVGRPRVVINGTALDFLAESFMAGDPYHGGGFIVLNGIGFDARGGVRALESPYPGANLFSLASGGAIYVRDPHRKLVPDQLNGGAFAEFADRDWDLVRPCLEENERLFGISVTADLLTVDGRRLPPAEVYRKVHAVRLAVLAKEEVPE